MNKLSILILNIESMLHLIKIFATYMTSQVC